MSTKRRDPLDEPDDLLADDEPTESEDLPEPQPSEIEPPPEPPSFVWEAGEEPPPSEIEILEGEEPDEDEALADEPDGDDLYWAETDEEETDGGWLEPEEGEAIGTEWSIEEEEAIGEEDWAALEEERLLPADRLLVGWQERVSLPLLGLTGLVATFETGLARSVLIGEAGEPITTSLTLGARTLSVTLLRAPGEPGLRLGRDVLAGVCLVDPSREWLLSSA